MDLSYLFFVEVIVSMGKPQIILVANYYPCGQ